LVRNVWLCHIRDQSATDVIGTLKRIFSIFGCPNAVYCNNIPFSGAVFK